MLLRLPAQFPPRVTPARNRPAADCPGAAGYPAGAVPGGGFCERPSYCAGVTPTMPQSTLARPGWIAPIVNGLKLSVPLG